MPLFPAECRFSRRMPLFPPNAAFPATAVGARGYPTRRAGRMGIPDYRPGRLDMGNNLRRPHPAAVSSQRLWVSEPDVKGGGLRLWQTYLELISYLCTAQAWRGRAQGLGTCIGPAFEFFHNRTLRCSFLRSSIEQAPTTSPRPPSPAPARVSSNIGQRVFAFLLK